MGANDGELMLEVQAGRTGALATLFERHHARLSARASRRARPFSPGCFASVAMPVQITCGVQRKSGEVLTDFELEVQSQPPVVEHGNDGGRYRVRLERAVTAVVGGGGPELQFKTFNGDIVIRKR